MDHISKYVASVVGLVEARVKESKAFRIIRCLPQGWNHLNN